MQQLKYSKNIQKSNARLLLPIRAKAKITQAKTGIITEKQLYAYKLRTLHLRDMAL